LVLCLTKFYAVKTFGWVDVQLHTYLTSVLDGGEWSVSLSGCLIPGGKRHKCPLGRRLCGLERRSGHCTEGKNPCPRWESKPGRPARSLVSILFRLPRLLFYTETCVCVCSGSYFEWRYRVAISAHCHGGTVQGRDLINVESESFRVS